MPVLVESWLQVGEFAVAVAGLAYAADMLRSRMIGVSVKYLGIAQTIAAGFELTVKNGLASGVRVVSIIPTNMHDPDLFVAAQDPKNPRAFGSIVWIKNDTKNAVAKQLVQRLDLVIEPGKTEKSNFFVLFAGPEKFPAEAFDIRFRITVQDQWGWYRLRTRHRRRVERVYTRERLTLHP